MKIDPAHADLSGSEPLLEIRNLVVEGQSGDHWQPIINDIDLTLQRGEILGLIGESGAGKSTLGLAAIGFARLGCRIASGQVLFDGIDLTKADKRKRRELRRSRFGYIAPSGAASFNPARRLIDQTVEIPVAYGLMRRAEAIAATIDLYQRMQLPNAATFGNRYPHQASGGQLQRAMIAMAMLSQPDVIVFDEPTTALDVTTQIDVLSTIRDVVGDSGMSAIYISHDLAVVAQMAQRIMVLKNGRLVESAPTREMLLCPKEQYTRTLWAVRALKKPSESPSDVLLRVESISAAYGPIPVLKDVSIAVPRGRTVSIVGESGSGKTTLARVVAGLKEPLSGQLYFKGEMLPPSLRERDRSLLRKVRLIYQSADTALNPRHTVRNFIGRPLRLYHRLGSKAVTQHVLELLAMCDLNAELIDRYPSELSSGQKQRVSIARALAAEPELIICDEITSSLDQLVQEEILRLLLKLQKKTGISYLFISHDIATVRAISDQVVIMKDGQVVEQGPKEEVLAPPHAEYTEKLLSAVPDMDPDWLTRVLKEKSMALAAEGWPGAIALRQAK